MEDEHEKTFAALRSELKDEDKQGTVFDPEGESALYLRALADTRVFFKKEIDTSSLKEILKAALTAEKDSIVFYLGMKDLVPEKLGKDKIDNIIREEMGHIKLIGGKLKAFTEYKIKGKWKMAKPEEMYQCQTTNCGYIYNPDKGDRKGKIAKGTQFQELPDDWKCPVCGASKKAFKPLG